MGVLKRFATFAMALILALGVMATPAFATQGTNDNSGSITINDAEAGHTYNAYQVLVLESYNTEAGAYSYKATSAWADWLDDQTQYVTIDDQGYVTWVKDADAVAFAKAAIEHAKANSIAPTATKTADSTIVEFTGLNLGYYLIDTTLGTLCSLDTAAPDVEMYEKNELPLIEKEVKEDSTGNWGEENNAEIGDTVEFKTTITAKKGAQSYVLHDVMSAGLTLNDDSIKVQVAGSDLDAANYTVATKGLTDGCAFEISFAQAYLDTIDTDTEIVVTYTAVVNENAEVFKVPNTNGTQLKFGDDHRDETTWDETKTYTFKVDVVKTDGDDKVLDGAQFKLYDAKTGGNEIALIEVSDGVYRFAKDGEQGVECITTVNGQLEIKGFDANTNYYLEETKAPDGYNKLGERVEIAVKEANIDATVSGDSWQSGGVHVVNNAGSLLPTAGGIGTTLFYVVGGALVIVAAIVLVHRKRRDDAK